MFSPKHLLIPLSIVTSLTAQALSFSSTLLYLDCPERGRIEVILHVYNHTEEKWKDNFEVGAGHKKTGRLELVKFVNGDVLIHDNKSDDFSYLYYGTGPIKHCVKITERTIHPTF